MSQYKLYTSGPYKQNDGSAITLTSTDINLGAAKQVADSTNLNRSDWTSGEKDSPNVVGGVDGVVSADLVAGVTISSFAEASNGLLQLTYNSAHGLTVNDIVVFDGLAAYTASYRVFSVTNSEILIINAEFVTGVDSQSDVPTFKLSGTFGVQGEDNFIMMKNDATVHGEANTKLASGASDYGRVKVAKFDISPKTTKVATAIRTDKYNSYDGTFDTGFPETVTDSINADDQTVDSTTKIGTKGELTFRSGGANPTSADYTAKTN